eukprot:jgi/Ulvmu1/12625/UM093_0018.1
MYGVADPLMRVNAPTQAVFDAWDARGADAQATLIELTREPKVNVNATAAYKSTMLHKAAASNWTRWALQLLSLGAKVDPRNSVEETPLLMAADKLHLPMMELLLKAGADPEAKDWRSRTVRETLMSARRTNRLPAQKALLLLDKFGKGPDRELAAKRLRERGNQAYKTGSPEIALKYYEQANEVQPHAFTFANAALVQISRRDWHGAAAAATKATQIDPGYGRAWHRLVKAHLNARNFPRALAAVKGALAALASEDKEVPRLLAVEGLLQGCGIRPAAAQPSGTVAASRKDVKARLSRGVPSAPCAFCRASLPTPLEQYEQCAWCECDPQGRLAAGLTDAVIAGIL